MSSYVLLWKKKKRLLARFIKVSGKITKIRPFYDPQKVTTEPTEPLVTCSTPPPDFCQYQKQKKSFKTTFCAPLRVLDLPTALSYIAGWHPPTIVQAIIANRIVIKFSITTSSRA